MITLNAAPANNLLKPNTEKNAALPAISLLTLQDFLNYQVVFQYHE